MDEAAGALILHDWNHHSRKAILADASRLDQAIDGASEGITQPSHGWYFVDEDTRSALFVRDGRLKLVIESKAWDWEADFIRVVHKHRGLHISEARVFSGHKKLFQKKYRSVIGKAIQIGDMTIDAIDEEATDWWIWLSRISREIRFRRSITQHLINGFG